MSSIVTSLTGGGSGGGAGMGFNAERADITNPVTKQQMENAGIATDTGLDNQQAFLQALQQQNGLGNQSSVFNQQQAVANGTGPNPAQAQLANATGQNVANQAALMAGQRGSSANSGMMARQAAQQGANTQQQAAGQAASLQAQQSLGALNQMGGIATNQANQQANATNAYTSSALQNQQNMLGAQGAYNNAQVGMQSNMNSANAAVSGVTAQGQQGLLGNMMGGIGSLGSMFGGSGGGDMLENGGEGADFTSGMSDADYSDFLGAEGGLVKAKYADGGEVDSQADPSGLGEMFDNEDAQPLDENSPAANTATSNNVANAQTELKDPNSPQSSVGRDFMMQQQALGAPAGTKAADTLGIKPHGGAAGSGGGGMGGIDMGELTKIGGMASKAWSGISDYFAPVVSGVGSFVGEALPAVAGGAADSVGAVGAAEVAALPEEAAVVAVAAKGGKADKKVKALVSPGEGILDPSAVKKVEKGADALSQAKKVPGTPKVGGAKNSYANDTVKKDLSAGSIVLPRSVTQSDDPAAAAHKFVQAIMAKKHGLKPSLKGK